MKRIAILIAGLAVVVASCGSDESSDTTSAETTTPTTTTPATLDPGQRILEITFEGGFAPVEFLFSRAPAYTLYGDGRLVSEGPAIGAFPGPLLTNFIVTDIGADGLNEVLSAVRASGIEDVVDEVNNDAANFVADAPSTVITYTDENGDHRYSVYALGIAVDEAPQLQALQRIVDTVSNLALQGPTSELPIERLQVLVTEDFGQSDEPGSRLADWPFATQPNDIPVLFQELRCLVVEGAELDEVLPILADADQLTFFDDGTASYRLTPRPLLPGETGCEAPQ